MKLNDLNLNKIAVFCQVVDAGNYRRAAEVLNITPSAISQTITHLEYVLGGPLFQRVGRKMIPNASGIKLHREFRRFNSKFMESIQGLSGGPEKVSGLLRIGAYLEFAKFRLAPVIKEFRQRFPEAQVKLVFDSPSRLHHLLETGKLDICFSIYSSGETRTIASRPVYHEELVLIAPPGLVSDSPTYEEIMKAPLIEYFMNHQPMRRWLYLHFKKKPKKLPIGVYAASAEMVLALVEEGAGLGVVPKFLLGRERRKSVKVIRPSPRRLLDHIWLLESKQSPRSKVHAAFDQLAEQAPRFFG